MKTKAAVAFAARKPLEITTVDLDGPRAGEVLVEIKASGICHTDEFTRSGADPEGLFPKVEAGANVVVFGLGGIGLNVVQGARMVGADKIVGVDLNPGRRALAEKFGMTHFVNPKEVEGDLVAHLVALTDGGADYSFECVGNVDLMRQALECCHRGWGVSVVVGVAGAGKEISTRPFQLVTGRVWKGTAFGGARGRTDVPKIVDWYMNGKINIDDLITHKMPLSDINKAFELMHSGESIRSVVVYS
jgi:S-(hydroxymethyl)glutathione dehydrogenase / alcohol dehydrogenase